MNKKISEFSGKMRFFLNYGYSPNAIIGGAILLAFMAILSVKVFDSSCIFINLYLVWTTFILIFLLCLNKKYTDRNRNFGMLTILLFFEVVILIYEVFAEPILLLFLWGTFPFEIMLIFLIIYCVKNISYAMQRPREARGNNGMIVEVIDLAKLCLESKKTKKIFQMMLVFFIFSVILSFLLLIVNYLILGAYIYFIYPIVITLLSIKIFLIMLSITKEHRRDLSILIGFGIFELLFMIFMSLLGAVLVIVLALLLKEIFNIQ